MEFERYIRDVPDFPKPGILFKDITPLLKNGPIFSKAVQALALKFSEFPIDSVVGIEARGYLIGAPLAFHLGKGFIPIRKSGKLPWETINIEYDLEYGTSRIEMHKDGIVPGENVLVVDDVLATGGTLEASVRLIEQAGAKISGIGLLLELSGLDGRKKLESYHLESLITV
jgi:adenine phosphoribosyltransferase